MPGTSETVSVGTSATELLQSGVNKSYVYLQDGEDVPFAHQPDWPDATPWADADEAKAWAELLIESMQNPKSEFIPGTSPSNHPRPRPEPVEIDPVTGQPIGEE